MPLRDVIGHRRLRRLLARAILRDVLPPSLLFTGQPGIGKRLVGVAVAQTVNCAAPVPFPVQSNDVEGVDACGVCPSCLRIARGVHPDVLIVEPGDSGSIKVDEVRDVIDRAGYRPFEGRRRIVIIDDADALVPAAQNALLKTLEEPPPSSVFLLMTSQPDVLLPTVQSRCPRLRFWPLAADEVASVLVASGRTDAEARALAAVAEGSVERALAADAGEIEKQRAVAARVLTEAARSDDPRKRLEAAKDLVSSQTGSAAGDRELLAAKLRMMASLVRDAEILGTRADRSALGNPDAIRALEPLSPFHGERGVQAYAAVDEALAAVKKNAGIKIVADWLVLRL
jgi:DNA polymerase-3 subunit delta'